MPISASPTLNLPQELVKWRVVELKLSSSFDFKSGLEPNTVTSLPLTTTTSETLPRDEYVSLAITTYNPQINIGGRGWDKRWENSSRGKKGNKLYNLCHVTPIVI